MRRSVLARVGLGTLVLVVACGGGEDAGGAETRGAEDAATERSTAAAPDAAAQQAAVEIFGMRCAVCHGPAGAGDGPGSAGLTPQPRNLQDPAWQTSVSDTHIEQIVLYGGAAVGKSPAMPANPDLSARPELVAALRAHIRSLGER